MAYQTYIDTIALPTKNLMVASVIVMGVRMFVFVIGLIIYSIITRNQEKKELKLKTEETELNPMNNEKVELKATSIDSA